ncbi:O-antigen ligase family protein [Alloalcanivorax marinus]|uniref:O-antigen ligase family protein n=1 Tax=Alloalcanivorax marinus TaxID=1177169 RepID=UPI0021CFD769|nr:O-antigen ligase family protein [Alloalcanivorax marinus]
MGIRRIDLPLLVVALVIFSMILLLQPWWLPPGISPYDYHRWVEVALLVLLICMAATGGSLKSAAFIPWIVPYLIFCFLVALACFFAESGIVSWAAGLRAIMWIAGIIIIVRSFSNIPARKLAWLLIALLVMLAVHVFYSMVGICVLLLNKVEGKNFIVSSFSNINHAAAFYGVCLFILPGVADIVYRSGLKVRGLLIFVGAGLAFLMLIIGSRGSYMAGIFAIVLTIFVFGKKSFFYIKEYLIYFLSGLAVFLVFEFFFCRHIYSGAGSGPGVFYDGGRVQLWSIAWKGFLDSPFLGKGPLSYAMNTSLSVTHPHNLLLSVLYEYGVFVALLGLLVTLKVSLFLWKERWRFRDDIPVMAGMAAVISFAVHSQVGGLAMIPLTVMIFSLGLSFCFSPVMSLVDERWGGVRWRPKTSILLSLLLGLFVFLYLFVVVQYWASLSHQGAAEPRFWLHGEIHNQ